MNRAEATGLVFAGGLGTRMDGMDKGLVPLRGRPLVTHVVERLAPQTGCMVISANRNNAAYAALGYPVVSDLIAGYAGPLAGLHAGLTACTTPLLCTAPCDAPLLPTDLVLRLADAMARDSAPVAVVRTDGHLQPTFILCRRAVLPNLEQYLAGGGRKFGAWLAIVGALPVDFADAHAFANINTREDLARLETQ